MNSITKERIELFIKNPLENGLTRGEQMELARIALASLEAEPVAWLHSDNGLGIPAITRSKNIADSWLSKGWYVHPLYIAKPVPVVPDARPSLNNGIVGFDEGWNACRAAMLQSGNFRENKNSSTNNFREIAETSTNYPVIPSEVLSAILKVAK
ncbi:Eaa protein, partial [Escherichia coli]|nr:Eaa protein [Escherichia coli]